jgi:hypothetical protein
MPEAIRFKWNGTARFLVAKEVPQQHSILAVQYLHGSLQQAPVLRVLQIGLLRGKRIDPRWQGVD